MSADTELVAELRAGLDGVTPGPYTVTTCADFWIEAGGKGIAECGDIHWLRSETTINRQEEMEANARHFARCSPDNIRALLDRIASLEAALEKAQSERDEATNWTDIVDRHGTDQFDDLAEAWLALPAIQRTTNAAISTFAKWANDDLMQRFRQNQLSMFHLAYVEGCLAGVKAAEAAALSSSKQKDGE